MLQNTSAAAPHSASALKSISLTAAARSPYSKYLAATVVASELQGHGPAEDQPPAASSIRSPYDSSISSRSGRMASSGAGPGMPAPSSRRCPNPSNSRRSPRHGPTRHTLSASRATPSRRRRGCARPTSPRCPAQGAAQPRLRPRRLARMGSVGRKLPAPRQADDEPPSTSAARTAGALGARCRPRQPPRPDRGRSSSARSSRSTL